MSDPFSTIISTAANQTYDFGMSLLRRKWAHDDRTHDENRQDSLLTRQEDFVREGWEREDRIRQDLWNREDQIYADQKAREDTAYQRSVADAKAAGLSPLAVSQLDSAGQFVAGTAGPSASGTGVGTQSPLSYRANEIVDSSTLLGSLLSQKNLDELIRHNKKTEEQEDNKQAQETEQFNMQLWETSRQFDELREEHGKDMEQNQMQHLDSMQHLAESLAKQDDWNTAQLNQRNAEMRVNRAIENNRLAYDEYSQFCKTSGLQIRTEKFYISDDMSRDERDEVMMKYNQALNTFKAKYDSELNTYLHDFAENPDAFYESYGIGTNTGENRTLGANGSVAGTGAGLNLSTGSNTGETESQSQNQRARAQWQKSFSGLGSFPLLMWK